MSEAQKVTRATYHLYTFLVSKLVGSIGANVYGFGMSLYILSVTGSALSFAGNMLSSILPRIALAPFAGTITDRVSRKILVVGGQIGEVAVLCGLLIYTLTNGLSVNAIYVTTACYTVFSTFSGIAFSASIPNLVDGERIQKAMSFNQLASSTAGILGPVIGGMLFGFVSIHMFLVINIVALSITTILESTMNFRLYMQEKVASAKASLFEDMKEGLRYVATNILIKRILLTIVWLNLFFTAISVGSSFIMLEELSIKSEHLGIIEAGLGVGVLVTSMVFASSKAVKNPIIFSRNAIIVMSILVGVFALPLIIDLSYYFVVSFYFVLMLLFGAFNIMTNMPIMVLFQTRVEEQYRGRVFGLIEMVALGLMPIGTLVYGVLFDILPGEVILIASSVILIVITILTLNEKVVAAEKAGAPA